MTDSYTVFRDSARLCRKTVQPAEYERVPYIGLEHVEEGTLRLSGIGCSTDVSSAKFVFSKGDILFGKLRPYFRKVLQVSFDGICSTDFWVVRAKPGTNQRYLFYLMASQAFVAFASQGSEGTKMPRAKWEYVERFRHKRLSEKEQKAVAFVLGTLDDKIELNRKMNQTLEGIARAIFKSWFVDFDPVRAKAAVREEHPEWSNEKVSRAACPNLKPEIAELFPASFVDSELGEIPKGWKAGIVEDLAEVTSGKRPYKRAKARESQFSVPLYGSGGIMGYVSEAMISEPILLTGRVGTLGMIFRITEKCWASDNTLILLPVDKKSLEFLYHVLEHIDFASLNRGSTQPLVTQTDLKNQKLVIPDQSVLRCFWQIVHPIFQKVDKNNVEATILRNIRDALLAPLISGQVRVSDAEKLSRRDLLQ